ncbi:superoxide dismutase [Actinomadura decatromicini]|uniref:Superoxide dismutase n=1 Tax=Actinomadura decatromicini TaxID=2604572 RepID=A0A5D3FFA7_9ACTN|nr:superoxide dismutase [Actinomadura decatromicini]
MWSRIVIAVLSAGLLVPVGGSAQGATGPEPDQIALPNGFQPEGIATGPGPVAFFGSRSTGAIYRADLRTGKGELISKGPGTPSLGLETRGDRLYVAGGKAGDARVVNTENGEVVKSYKLTTKAAFINDVALTKDAAWFSDSTNQQLYRVPLSGDGEVKTLPLTGDIVWGEGFNSNGIEALDGGKSLVLIQSNTGKLFKVDPETGVAKAIGLGGEILTAGDGILLAGRTVYAVQNRLNTVAVIELNDDATEGKIVKKLTDPRFDVPTSVARSGSRLYLPNARFTTTPTPDTPYTAVAVTP